MRECERQFGLTRGTQIRESIEQATGEPCPCDQGLICPLRRLLAEPPAVAMLLAVGWISKAAIVTTWLGG